MIPSFEELLRSTVETDFAPLYSCLETLPDIKIAEIVPGDDVITMVRRIYDRQRVEAKVV